MILNNWLDWMFIIYVKIFSLLWPFTSIVVSGGK